MTAIGKDDEGIYVSFSEHRVFRKFAGIRSVREVGNRGHDYNLEFPEPNLPNDLTLLYRVGDQPDDVLGRLAHSAPTPDPTRAQLREETLERLAELDAAEQHLVKTRRLLLDTVLIQSGWNTTQGTSE